MLAVDRVHRWRLLFSPRSCFSLRGVDVPETLVGFQRTIPLCFSTGTVSSLLESGGTSEASREETTVVVPQSSTCRRRLLLGVITTRPFSKPYSFCRYTTTSIQVKRFGCYVKHQKKKKRKKKRRHHFCAPSSSSFKRFFLCLFE